MRILLAKHQDRHGQTPDRLRTRAKLGELVQLYPGAYLDLASIDDAKLTPEMMHAARIAAIAPALGSGVVSGPSAATIHGIWVPKSTLSGPITVTRASGGTTSRWLNARRSLLAPGEVMQGAHVRVTTIERTIRDLADQLELHDLVGAIDSARRLGGDRDAVKLDGKYRRRLATALELSSDRSESAAESRSRVFMHHFGVPKPLEQVSVFDERGRLLGRGDFGWPDARTLGEVDGGSKYDRLLAPGQSAKDAVMKEKWREQDIRDDGWNVARWGWAHTMQPPRFAQMLLRALDTGRHLPLPRGRYELEPLRPLSPPDWSGLFDQLR